MKISAPIEAWEVKLEITTNRPTDQQTDRQTDRQAHREDSLPKLLFGCKLDLMMKSIDDRVDPRVEVADPEDVKVEAGRCVNLLDLC